ncbi:MAG: polyamine aminopropyltransferase [Gammaproteobacteria bacterium]|nr:polyamine aminopropyltransferase [Gammaproteobacteria bacterium]
MSHRRWFSETLTPGLRLSFQARRVLRHRKSASHEVALIDNEVFGRVLLLDGAVQLTTRDEFVYHEMMAHVPILGHGSVRDVLIVGGGDCGLAEEVLKHRGVARVTQVEIDPSVVELARTHFADINASVFDDPRFKLVVADAAEFVQRSGASFDVALVDSTDPLGPGAVLFTEQFYRDVRARLRAGGVLVTQNGVPFLQEREFAAAMRALARVFAHVGGYAIAVPTYFGGHLVLGWSTDDDAALRLPLPSLAARFDASALDTRYYTPRVHAAAFALPRFIEQALERAAGRRPASPFAGD